MTATPNLPFVDEPSVTIAATARQTWDALVQHLATSLSGSTRTVAARVLGCRHVDVAGTLPDVGAQVPGFVVTESQPPQLLSLRGRHRTSDYSLTFRIDGTDLGNC